jgi:hypothetical protein
MEMGEGSSGKGDQLVNCMEHDRDGEARSSPVQSDYMMLHVAAAAAMSR